MKKAGFYAGQEKKKRKKKKKKGSASVEVDGMIEELLYSLSIFYSLYFYSLYSFGMYIHTFLVNNTRSHGKFTCFESKIYCHVFVTKKTFEQRRKKNLDSTLPH